MDIDTVFHCVQEFRHKLLTILENLINTFKRRVNNLRDQEQMPSNKTLSRPLVTICKRMPERTIVLGTFYGGTNVRVGKLIEEPLSVSCKNREGKNVRDNIPCVPGLKGLSHLQLKMQSLVVQHCTV